MAFQFVEQEMEFSLPIHCIRCHGPACGLFMNTCYLVVAHRRSPRFRSVQQQIPRRSLSAHPAQPALDPFIFNSAVQFSGVICDLCRSIQAPLSSQELNFLLDAYALETLSPQENRTSKGYISTGPSGRHSARQCCWKTLLRTTSPGNVGYL